MNAAHFREMTDTQKHEYCMACAMRDNHAAMSEFYAYEKYLDKSIVIVKGRKIPIGTKGVCFYVGLAGVLLTLVGVKRANIKEELAIRIEKRGVLA